jgi:hypothetical protein
VAQKDYKESRDAYHTLEIPILLTAKSLQFRVNVLSTKARDKLVNNGKGNGFAEWPNFFRHPREQHKGGNTSSGPKSGCPGTGGHSTAQPGRHPSAAAPGA